MTWSTEHHTQHLAAGNLTGAEKNPQSYDLVHVSSVPDEVLSFELLSFNTPLTT